MGLNCCSYNNLGNVNSCNPTLNFGVDFADTLYTIQVEFNGVIRSYPIVTNEVGIAEIQDTFLPNQVYKFVLLDTDGVILLDTCGLFTTQNIII